MDSNSKIAPLKKGPSTDRGRAVSARNSVKHGLMSAKAPLLLTENKETFERILCGLVEEYQPTTQTQRMLIEQLAVSWLRLYRLWDAEAAATNEARLEAEKKQSYPDSIKTAGELLSKVGMSTASKEKLARIEEGISAARMASALPDYEKLNQLSKYERHILRTMNEALDRLIELRQLAP